MAYRFNPPPGWPTPPSGWTPPAGWTPDPSWPAPPQNWSFWIEEVSSPAATAPIQTPEIAKPAAGKQTRGLGMFGGPKKADLASEVEELRSALARVDGLSSVEVARELARARNEADEAKVELARLQNELALARAQIVETNEIAQLQEAGVYEYAHPLTDAVAYKDLLARVKADTKSLVSEQ